MTAFVSVIVPVYNDRKALQTCLDLLLAQSYPELAYEIIVADNGSTDGARELGEAMAGAYPGRVHVVVENTIRGSYAARNRGILAARGSLLAFTDADCLPDRDWLRAGASALEAEQAACGGGRIAFTFRGERPTVYEYFDSARKLDQEAYVKNAGFAATANFFARCDLFERHGPFRADLMSGGDVEFGRRTTSAGEKLIFIPEALVYHAARGSFMSIYRKSKRVATGQKQLAALGVANAGVSWRSLLPRLSYPRDSRYSPTFSTWEKIQLVLLSNIVRWVNYHARR